MRSTWVCRWLVMQSMPAAESVEKWKALGLHRTFLHAHRLAFEALSGEELQFEAPLPESLKAVLNRCEA